MLEHTNWEVRMVAARNLNRKVSHPDVAVLALTRALSDPDFRVQRIAARSLGQFKVLAKPAVPSLLGLLSNTNAFVAVFASNALLRIDPAALPPRGP
jgi:HEAT repeat protein